MRTALCLVTYARDIDFVRLCLASIACHARGFCDLLMIVPTDHADIMATFEGSRCADGVAIQIRHHYEAADKGHVWMNATKAQADLFCPHADVIVHIDADCVFTRQVTPQHYFFRDKLVMLTKPYAEAGDALAWKPMVDRALRVNAPYECMQSPQLAYWRDTYVTMRREIERLHAMPFMYYALTHGFAEYPTLGTWALMTQPELYHQVDVNSNEARVREPFIFQGWSLFRENEPALQAELNRLRGFMAAGSASQ